MKFFQTLHGKLSAALLALMVTVGLFLVPLTLFAVRGYSEEVAQQLNRSLASDLAAHLTAKNLLRADFASDEKLRVSAGREISQLMVLNPDIEIYVLDARGRILAHSVKSQLKVQRVDLKPVQRFLTSAKLPVRGDDPLHMEARKVFSAARINSSHADSSHADSSHADSSHADSSHADSSHADSSHADSSHADALDGYVYIVLGSEAYHSVAGITGRSYALRGVLWIMAGALSLVFGAGVLLFRVLTRRLRRLEREMTAFGTRFALKDEMTDFTVQGDEIARLHLNFAALAQCVSTHVVARERSENTRRELMSNISHDLRTPLAALQGYLETLHMKDEALSAPERQQYLSTAMKRAAHLNALIGSLFELAKLDATEAKPQLEPFVLAELVQDKAQQFALAAERKGVRLQAHFTDDLPMVLGDIGLIERALENLLDNALRHTPVGGLVAVRVTPCDESGRRCARVEVRDSGEGIAPADLPHIFERSFRVVKGGEGAGLGLAITKRILELHDETVEVQSTPGAGAAFSFRLWAPK